MDTVHRSGHQHTHQGQFHKGSAVSGKRCHIIQSADMTEKPGGAAAAAQGEGRGGISRERVAVGDFTFMRITVKGGDD